MESKDKMAKVFAVGRGTLTLALVVSFMLATQSKRKPVLLASSLLERSSARVGSLEKTELVASDEPDAVCGWHKNDAGCNGCCNLFFKVGYVVDGQCQCWPNRADICSEPNVRNTTGEPASLSGFDNLCSGCKNIRSCDECCLEHYSQFRYDHGHCECGNPPQDSTAVGESRESRLSREPGQGCLLSEDDKSCGDCCKRFNLAGDLFYEGCICHNDFCSEFHDWRMCGLCCEIHHLDYHFNPKKCACALEPAPLRSL